MDVFVLPTYREGFPTVSLEASSMNLPVITTDATGCEESIIDNKTGLFVLHKSADIAEKILHYLNNENISYQHGNAGRDYVRLNFEQTIIWDIISKNLSL